MTDLFSQHRPFIHRLAASLRRSSKVSRLNRASGELGIAYSGERSARTGRALVASRAVTIACAVALALPAEATAAHPPIPPTTLAKIRATQGDRYAVLPAWMPAGYVFMGWRTRAVTPLYLTPTLDLSFARNGSSLDWTVMDARGTKPGCDAAPGIQERVLRYRGLRMVWSTGNRFASLDTCVRAGGATAVRLDISLLVESGPGAPPLADLERMLRSAAPVSARG